jgi:acetyltransferase
MRITWDLPLTADGVSGEMEDGTPFVVRPIRASDADALETAFQSMSPRSRYLRFFTVRQQLGEAMTKKLTELDHDTHRAWVILDPSEPSDVGTSEGRGVAVARLITVEGEPTVAEAALAVVDDHQGRGFGKVLLRLLMGTASDTGIKFLRFETLQENTGIQALLRDTDAVLNRELSDREVVVFDVPVPAPNPDDVATGALYEILRWIAASEE